MVTGIILFVIAILLLWFALFSGSSKASRREEELIKENESAPTKPDLQENSQNSVSK